MIAFTDDPCITTSAGISVWVVTRRATGERIIILDHPEAPKDMRWTEAGRIISGHFQPAEPVDFAMSTEVLRAIADLMDAEADR